MRADVPEHARYLSFQFRFGEAQDGDYAAVLFDEAPIWKVAASSALGSEYVDSGSIPIRGFAGAQHEIVVALYGVGAPNAEFAIRNFETISVESITLGAQTDAFIYTGPPNRNEGANPRLQVQTGGMHRALVAFDSAAIDDFVTEHGLSSATLALNIANLSGNWGSGRDVDADPLLEDFEEGNGKRNGLSMDDSLAGEGAGVTWRCAVDTDISNQQTDCANRWDGGSFASPTAPPVVHVNGLSGQVEWDVTEDVLAGDTAWLIKLADEQGGGTVLYYSKEGAIQAGNVDFAPRLILEK